jgi:3-hydroxyacyl-CoA dehydrogenase/enoyl-CoA hydratase/carnithine racemase
LTAETFTLSRSGDVAVVTIDDGSGRPTVLSRSALESLQRCLDELEQQEWKALVLTGRTRTRETTGCFAVGADISQFSALATTDAAREGARAGHALFGRLRALPFPTVAAINGACLGGGLELALHCDARTVGADVRHAGFPECFLGLIPGWGGTQLLPRLAGARVAVKVIVENAMRQNRMLDAQTLVELGIADRLFDADALLEESVAWSLELAASGPPRPDDPYPDREDAAEIVARARRSLDDAVRGTAPAPYRALELIEGAAHWTYDEGIQAEEDAFAELLPGDEAQASVYAFQLVEFRQKKLPGIPKVEPRAIRKVGVVGAGLMATQLAQLYLRRLGVPIVIRDIDAGKVDEALDTLRETAADPQHASLVSGTTGWQGFEDCDLVLEAVFEEVGVKQEVLAAAENVVRPDCILATNTSALSVTELGSGLRHPERLVGMHFFNPVAMMPLVELVRSGSTDDVTLATAAALTRALRKRGVLVGDGPAFVVNRVLTRMTCVLMQALEHGNSVAETDEAILRLGLPMAPSVLLQLVGPRVANRVLEALHAAYPERFPLSPTLANYADGHEEIVVAAQAPVAVEQITEAVLEALADEIAHLLADGIVPSAADVDTCLLLGAGFPFWLGGITKHLDQKGISERLFGRPLAEMGNPPQ